jgi:hypothetical protein
VLLVEVFADAVLGRSEAELKEGGARVNNVVLFQSADRELVNAAELECAPELVTDLHSARPSGVDAELLALVASGGAP